MDSDNILNGDARKTAGQIIKDINSTSVEYHNPTELVESGASDYMKQLFSVLEDGKKTYNKDFFIESNHKLEKALGNVPHDIINHRSTCPSPEHDQTVYHYIHDDSELKLLWVIPDQLACWKLFENRSHVDPSQYELLNYVLAAKDGTLWKMMKKLNNEEDDSPLLRN